MRFLKDRDFFATVSFRCCNSVAMDPPGIHAEFSRRIYSQSFVVPVDSACSERCDDRSTRPQYLPCAPGLPLAILTACLIFPIPSSLLRQLLVSVWDRDTSVDVLGHWLSMMHVHDTAAGGAAGTGCSGGWLPREQILGEGARRRVPAAFMAQVSLEAGAQRQRALLPLTFLLCLSPDTTGRPSPSFVFFPAASNLL